MQATKLRRVLAAVALAGAAAAPAPARAWGPEGHRLVAELAERRLTGAAAAEVARLLAVEAGTSLGSVASWADETRDTSTAPWHWVNFHRGDPCAYDPDRDCIGGNCVVGAIRQQVAILASKAPDEERLRALKYVVHFIGDVHQPLHGGFADDRGGNGYQIQGFGRGTNLHQVWDNAMIQVWPGGEAMLRTAIEADATPVDTNLAPEKWVEESCRIVATGGFYPDGHQLAPAYLERWGPVLVQRMAAAARRLSAVLNATLSAR
jgi:hypothetical protein